MSKATLGVGFSPLSYRIYAGKSKPIIRKDGTDTGLRQFTGQKVDVTENALKVVFEYLKVAAEEGGGGFGSEEHGYIRWTATMDVFE